MTEACYRHPDRLTAVRCTRCERPVCPECMIVASVGHQCPTCVEEAREEFRRSGAGPVAVRPRSGGTTTRALLVTLVAVYVLSVVAGGSLLGSPSTRTLLRLGALQPYLIARGEWWRLLTAMFLHASVIHIAFNAYALYLFGAMVEAIFGPRRYLAIYLVTGLVASVTSYAFGPVAALGVGASGAIFGVFGAFIAYNLRRRNTVQGMAALRWAGTLVLLNLVIALGVRSVDWRAHLGGLIAGLVAGWAADGVGSGAMRRWSPWIGMGALLAVAFALAVARTGAIRALPMFPFIS